MNKILFVSFFLALTTYSNSQSWNEVAKSFPYQYQKFLSNLNFSSSLDMDGNYSVVGNTKDFNENKYVCVFKKNQNGWEKVATLYSPDSSAYSFGSSVAIEGDVIVVSSQNYFSYNSGAAFVYVKPSGGWVDTIPSAILNPSDGNKHKFGSAVDISNETIIVGQVTESSIGGRILVYEMPANGWVDTTEHAILTMASPTPFNSQFGSSIAIDSNVIVSGFADAITMGVQSGCAYIFEKDTVSGWYSGSETALIYPSDGENFDKFGLSVSISKNNIIVGSPLHSLNGNESGAVYVFSKTNNTWAGTTTETAKLSATLLDSLEHFGQSVSIYDSVVLVGAPGTITSANRSGASFIYKQPPNGWVNSSETAYLYSSDGYQGDLFGNEVVINNGNVLIGAPKDDDFGPKSGSAYFFKEDSLGWGSSFENQKVWPTEQLINHGPFPGFASSVAVHGRYSVIGNCGGPSGTTEMVYLMYYNDTTWSVIGTLYPSDPGSKLFGYSVAMEEDYIVVGAPHDSEVNSSAGAVYVYKKPINGWRTMTQTAKLTPSFSGTNFELGTSVEISGNVIVSGAPQLDINQTNSAGGVFLFEKPALGWHDNYETAILTSDQNLAGSDLGFSVDIHNDVVVAGAPDAESGNMSGANGNRVYVYEKPPNGWEDMTQTAVLTKSSGLNYEFGYDVAVDSNLIVVSAWKEYIAPYTGTGLVYLFEKNPNGWQDTTESYILSHTADGIGANKFGSSVDVDGDTVVVGALYHGISTTNGSGAIYLFVKEANGWKDTTETRRYYPNTSVTGQKFGSDLAIHDGRIVVAAREDSIGSQTNVPYQIGSAFLLESCHVIPVNLTLSKCNSYVLPSGVSVMNSGVYTDYINTGAGCDSVIIFDLTISDLDTTIYVSGNNIIISETNADSYQWLDCDSSLLAISGANAHIFTPNISDGNYAVAMTKNGCIDTTSCFQYLDCYPTSNTVTLSSCDPYTSPSGNQVWSQSGTYVDTILNAAGCDSVLTIYFNYTSPSINVIQSGNVLICSEANLTYQWLDCNNGFSSIPGETDQSFYPSVNGNYAVAISNSVCSDTSLCFVINSISLNENHENSLSIFPNPTDDIVFIEQSTPINEVFIEDMLGRKVFIRKFEGNTNKIELNVSTLEKASYILTVLDLFGNINKSVLVTQSP